MVVFAGGARRYRHTRPHARRTPQTAKRCFDHCSHNSNSGTTRMDDVLLGAAQALQQVRDHDDRRPAGPYALGCTWGFVVCCDVCMSCGEATSVRTTPLRRPCGVLADPAAQWMRAGRLLCDACRECTQSWFLRVGAAKAHQVLPTL